MVFPCSLFLLLTISGLDPSNLEISILSGKAVMRNLKLKKTVLDKFNLAITVKEGFLGEIDIKIPWTKLSSESAIIKLSGLYILAEPVDVQVCLFLFEISFSRKKVKISTHFFPTFIFQLQFLLIFFSFFALVVFLIFFSTFFPFFSFSFQSLSDEERKIKQYQNKLSRLNLAAMMGTDQPDPQERSQTDKEKVDPNSRGLFILFEWFFPFCLIFSLYSVCFFLFFSFIFFLFFSFVVVLLLFWNYFFSLD